MDSRVYQRRREAVYQAIGNNAALILPAATSKLRNQGTEYPFRQDSNFYYLSGLNEDQACLVIMVKDHQPLSWLFTQQSTAEEKCWSHSRLGCDKAQIELGFEQAYPYAELGLRMPLLLRNLQKIYYPMGQDQAFEQALQSWLKALQPYAKRGAQIPTMHIESNTVLHELRLIKDAHELALMREAARISAQGHIRAMQVCKVGMWEYELEAQCHYEFCRHGARVEAYPSIVGGGNNACTLHYTQNNQPLVDQQLVLIDAGAEYQNYAADITRTFPINGQFTAPQRAIYELVLAAQLAGIDQVRAGRPWSAMQQAILEVLVPGLVTLGILQGEIQDLIEQQHYQPFYRHQSGHWLGLDVHDVGHYKIKSQWRLLKPGMVVTVEPGLYFPQDCTAVEKKWRGIGVRIEDDVLVTTGEPEILSALVPKTVSEIEGLMQNS
jgi:Xaa-Pro aminopeptidase